MVFIYLVEQFAEELRVFAPTHDVLECSYKLQELHNRYIELNEHCQVTTEEERSLEQDDYGQ